MGSPEGRTDDLGRLGDFHRGGLVLHVQDCWCWCQCLAGAGTCAGIGAGMVPMQVLVH